MLKSKMDRQEKYRWHYIGSLIVVSLIAVICFIGLSLSYHNRLAKISEIQNQDCERIARIIHLQAIDNNHFLKDTNSLSNVFDEHEKRMQGLMEMEFEKLQNDFNFISLWAGLITIVFLIFSIYSIFKTDEMLKKSDKVYDDIKEKADIIDIFTKKVQEKYRQELNNLHKRSEDYLKELSQKVGLINERLASIDSSINQAKNAGNCDDVVQGSFEYQTIQDTKAEE